MSKGKVGIVGSGVIGSNWAAMFLSGGYTVCMYDVSQQQLDKARTTVRAKLDDLASRGLSLSGLSVDALMSHVSATTSLEQCMADACYVQESAFECADFKRNLFSEMDSLVSPGCVLASSSSTIPASRFTEAMVNRSRCLIAHPVNPPLYLPLVELVPAPWTDAQAVDTAHAILTDIGQSPIRLSREVAGFAVNRLQYAIMAEAWRLVADGVMQPEDVDKVMSAGLGPRYAFYGPLEVMHMNANGISDYCNRYGAGIRAVLADMGPNPTFQEPEVIAKIEKSLSQAMPIEDLDKFRAEREHNLALFKQLKNNNQ